MLANIFQSLLQPCAARPLPITLRQLVFLVKAVVDRALRKDCLPSVHENALLCLCHLRLRISFMEAIFPETQSNSRRPRRIDPLGYPYDHIFVRRTTVRAAVSPVSEPD